ncbi:MAG: peptidylprolyl isomerase [Thermodesulfovibrionales bacterium]
MRTMLVLFILLSATGVSNAAVLLDKIVAVVNQEVITWSELYRNMESDASPQLKALKEDERVRVFKSNEASYLETLINVRLQVQEARSIGMSVSDDEVKEAIENIKKKYAMSDDDFRASLKKEGLIYDDYRKKLQEQILISKIVNHQVKGKVIATDAEISSFIDGNKDFKFGGEGYRLSQIFFKMPKTAGDRKTVEEKAALVMSKLKEGEPFRDLAIKYSEEPMGSTGGDLGLISKDQLMKEFAEALAELKQDEVSRPFWTERGLHIIRLTEKIAPKDQTQIRDEAQKEVSNRIFMDKYNKWIKALREKAFIEIRL